MNPSRCFHRPAKILSLPVQATYTDCSGQECVITHYHWIKDCTLGAYRPVDEIRIQPHELQLRRAGFPTWNSTAQAIVGALS